MNVRVFLLKKFPTDKYLDCPVPKNYYGIMQEYAEVYHESKVKLLNIPCVSDSVCEHVFIGGILKSGKVVGNCMKCGKTQKQIEKQK